MKRTTTIATLTASALLATGVAWAGVSAVDDSAEPPVLTVTATASESPSDDPSADPSPSDDPTVDSSPSDDPTVDDSPSDDPSADSSDAPVAAMIVERTVLDAGSITVSAEGFAVDLVAAVPADGWRVVVEQDGPVEVDLSFRRGEERVDVGVEVDDGALRIRITDRRTDERTEEYVDADGSTTGPLDRDGEPSDDGSDDDLVGREDDDLDEDRGAPTDDASDDVADDVDSIDSPDSDDSDDVADEVQSVDSPDSDDSDDVADEVESVDSPDSADSDD